VQASETARVPGRFCVRGIVNARIVRACSLCALVARRLFRAKRTSAHLRGERALARTDQQRSSARGYLTELESGRSRPLGGVDGTRRDIPRETQWSMAQPTSSALRALALEYKSLQEEPVEGFRVKLVNEDNMFEWEVAIFGPPDTLYQGGYFKVPRPFLFPRCVLHVMRAI